MRTERRSVLMQTVCIDGSIIEPRYISTDGQDHESGADEEESNADQELLTQSLLKSADVTLELCCNVHGPCYLDLEYRPLYSPGAHLSRVVTTPQSPNLQRRTMRVSANVLANCD